MNTRKKVNSMAAAAGIRRPRWDGTCRSKRFSSPRDYSRKGKKRWDASKEV